jgi:hypothetical protein
MNKQYAPGTLDDTQVELILLQEVIQRLIHESTQPVPIYRGICEVIQTAWIHYSHYYGLLISRAPIFYFPLLFKSIDEEIKRIGYNAGYMAPLNADGLNTRIAFLVRKSAAVKLNMRRVDFPMQDPVGFFG